MALTASKKTADRERMESTPVPIHQFPHEFGSLVRLYQERKPKRTLEIGTYDGGTFYHWLTNATKGATVVSCDLYDFEDFHDNRELYAGWTPKGVTCEIIAGDSTKPRTRAKVRKFAPYDFVFIDGDHSYDVARRDYDFAHEVIAPGGIIALHDIVPPPGPAPWMEVYKLWDQIKGDGLAYKQYVDSGGQSWGGIGVVFC